MGHTRLGKIPTTRRWREVVAVYAAAGGSAGTSDYRDELPRIASSTLAAAASAMKAARQDPGIKYIFFLLTQLALAARRPNFDSALEALGLKLPVAPSHLDFTTEVHRALDEHFVRGGAKTDISEMAQLALGETLASYFRTRPGDLFSANQTDLRADLQQLGTQRAFGDVSRHFFAGLMSRLLGFYLSKIVKPGPEQKLVRDVGDLSRFNEELRQHVFQRAFVVYDFASKWFSKTEFEKGIDPQNASRFVSYACKKIEDEFMRDENGQ
jgi:hypothetical protein